MTVSAPLLSVNILNFLFGGVPFERPNDWWVSLWTGYPPDNLGSELSGNGYSRQEVFWQRSVGVLEPTIENINLVKFETTGADWDSFSYIGLNGSSSGGSVLAVGPYTGPVNVVVSQFAPLYLEPGKLKLAIP